ncbi:MAG: hypothetical protein QM756_28660 [Polyangiaceae bacterium]
MDPLVRSTLWLQRQISRGTGTALAGLFGGYLVLHDAWTRAQLWSAGCVGAFVGVHQLPSLPALAAPTSEPTRPRVST